MLSAMQTIWEKASNFFDQIIDWLVLIWNVVASVMQVILIWGLDYLLQGAAWLLHETEIALPSLSIAEDVFNVVNRPAEIIGWLNWLIPMDVLTLCVQVYLGVVVINFTVLPFLRWAKIVSG